MNKQKRLLIKLTVTAMLIALYFVFDRFTAINLLSNQYKLSFIPLIIGAVFFGPVCGIAVGGLGDLISAVLMPTGAYFPGFTLVSALMGLVFGLLCYKKLTLPRILLAVFLCQGVCSLILNTFNLAVYFMASGITKYGTSVLPIVTSLAATRAIQAGVYFVAETVFLLLLIKAKPKLENLRVMREIHN